MIERTRSYLDLGAAAWFCVRFGHSLGQGRVRDSEHGSQAQIPNTEDHDGGRTARRPLRLRAPAAGASIVALIRSALFSVSSDIGTPSSSDVQQIAISAFGVGVAPCAIESTLEVVKHEIGVWLGHRGARRMGYP